MSPRIRPRRNHDVALGSGDGHDRCERRVDSCRDAEVFVSCGVPFRTARVRFDECRGAKLAPKSQCAPLASNPFDFSDEDATAAGSRIWHENRMRALIILAYSGAPFHISGGSDIADYVWLSVLRVGDRIAILCECPRRGDRQGHLVVVREAASWTSRKVSGRTAGRSPCWAGSATDRDTGQAHCPAEQSEHSRYLGEQHPRQHYRDRGHGQGGGGHAAGVGPGQRIGP